MEGMVMNLLFFDVDGTLLLTGGAGIRAMTDAFEELFGIGDAFRGSTMAGRTDNWVLAHALTRHNVTPRPEALARFSAVYVSHLRRQLDKPGPRKGIMPGVMSLLTALRGRSHARVSLLTGNYREGARAKLEYFGLWNHFTGGAFGDDVPERNLLLPMALTEAERDGATFTLDDVVVIGDTPLDVAGALAGGVRAVAVATGEYGVDELRTAGATTIFEDLSDSPAVLKALGL
jgi:phosphoglycolate phosphatase